MHSDDIKASIINLNAFAGTLFRTIDRNTFTYAMGARVSSFAIVISRRQFAIYSKHGMVFNKLTITICWVRFYIVSLTNYNSKFIKFACEGIEIKCIYRLM